MLEVSQLSLLLKYICTSVAQRIQRTIENAATSTPYPCVARLLIRAIAAAVNITYVHACTCIFDVCVHNVVFKNLVQAIDTIRIYCTNTSPASRLHSLPHLSSFCCAGAGTVVPSLTSIASKFGKMYMYEIYM